MISYNFIQPRKAPVTTSGYLVLQSDDGKTGDFTHWMPLFERKNREYNQWAGVNVVPFTPAVITSNINNNVNYMNTEQLQKIVTLGGEIASHGKTHSGMYPHKLQADANAGDTLLKVNEDERMLGLPREYTITDGSTTETIIVSERGAKGECILETGLQNSFPAGSALRVEETSATWELEEAYNDITSWGFECKSHVFPWNQNDEFMRNLASQFFENARGEGNPPVNEAETTDFYEVKGLNINGLTTTKIDSILDELHEKDAVGILYGHSEKHSELLDMIEYAIDGCMSRGIKLVTQSQGVNILKNKL